MANRRNVNCLVTLILILVPLWAFAEPRTGSSEQHPINQSGIRGEILFLDTGNSSTGLIISGTATGLDPAASYISLRYDRGSVPGGPVACEPTDGLTAAQMFVGFWTVNSDGTGSIFAQLAGDTYTPLTDIGTISIRLASDGSLQACGEIHRNRK
ncbi:hypothetical protein L0222_28740 [bacterium]|nr:hypothetical protein [bacterium]MCI0604111.1 hypothetical protein [bacterium]